MSYEDSIRKRAVDKGWYKYYSVSRPVDIGTYPRKDSFRDFINYDERKEVENYVLAFGELYYDVELTEKEMLDYDLVKAEEHHYEEV